MPKNPLVVFFKESALPSNGVHNPLPVAFDAYGSSFDPTRDRLEVLLIILNECSDTIPVLVHSNKNAELPLRIIWHNENEEKKNGLMQYGRPTRVTGFSHTPQNTIHQSLVKILKDEGDAGAFVRQWQKTADLEVYEELAAVIQLLSFLTPQTPTASEAYERYTALLGSCSDEDLKISVTGFFDKKLYLDAVQAIEIHAGKMLNE